MSSIAEQMHRQLAQTLSTTALEVIDESAAHAGHAGSNGTDFGTHFRVRIGVGDYFAGTDGLARYYQTARDT